MYSKKCTLEQGLARTLRFHFCIISFFCSPLFLGVQLFLLVLFSFPLVSEPLSMVISMHTKKSGRSKEYKSLTGSQ